MYTTHIKPVQILQRGFLFHVGRGMSVCIVLHFYSWSMWPKSAANPVSMQPFLILRTLFAQSDYPHMLLFVLTVYWQPCWNSWQKDKAIFPYYSALSTLSSPCSYITSTVCVGSHLTKCKTICSRNGLHLRGCSLRVFCVSSTFCMQNDSLQCIFTAFTWD